MNTTERKDQIPRWLSDRSGLLWPGTWTERASRMIRRDLEAAGISYESEQGVFDFHSLRHQFLSDLASSGVHPKVAQELARHSTITLTMDRYAHVLDEQKTEAIESLPAFGELTENLTETFSTDCPQESQVVTMGGEESCPEESIEVVDGEAVSTDCHKVAQTDSSSGGRTRTYDTRIMILPQQPYLTPNSPRKPGVRKKVDTKVDTTPLDTAKQRPIDPDLTTIIAAWHDLPDAVKQAILLLVANMKR